jgi:peptide/nickel transport system ATP-binding protein/energy-coupling factor transport system ATP-binding protein
MVRVRDAFVAFRSGAGAIMALRGADLTLAAGERLLVQGPNGSGKTTLLRVITGEQPVLAGTVAVGGTVLHAISATQRRQWRARSVGFIDQHAGRGLLPELSVLDNVALQLRFGGQPADQARRIAREALARLGLEELLARPVAQLSGGEAQRVAACAAVAHRPNLILADEPTGELDDASAAEVYELLAAVAADGTAVILVSHDHRAAPFADRTVRIRDGRAAEQWRPGSPAVEQLPDSRGWIRVPTGLLPEWTPLPGLVGRRQDSGLLLQPIVRIEPQQQSGRRPPQASGSRPEAGSGRRSTAATGPLLTLTGVSAGFGGRTLFAHLDLALRAGSWAAVTGPSGSGKSTLLLLIGGLLNPLAGTIDVGSVGWSTLSRDARSELRREWISLVPQRPSLVEALTIRENLQLTAAVRHNLEAPEDLEQVADRLGLFALLDQPVSLLSGGERQRTAIARCLMAHVPVLVLDEPTSQQDDESALRTIAALKDEVAAGRAVIAASHDTRLNAEATTTVDLSPGGPYAAG